MYWNPTIYDKETEFLLEKIVEDFFTPRLPLKRPLLVGFSGGSDSMALVQALWKKGLPIHLAHFDHGWRDASQEEAKHLRAWASARNLPFLMKRKAPSIRSELEAREARYAFFEELSSDYSALILAHHQLDQAETVLKRVMEGAHLETLRGMRSTAHRGAWPIWRPLLDVPKETILSYIEEESLRPIEDSTNLDPSYLRGRMRTELFPALSKAFGKEIVPALERLADYGRELHSYMETQTEALQPISGPFGQMWELEGVHPYEIRFLIHRHFQVKKVTADNILDALSRGAANLRVEEGERRWIVDRGRLFALLLQPPAFRKTTPLKPGTIECEEGLVQIHEGRIEGARSGWKGWWQGKIFLNLEALQEGEYSLSPPTSAYRKIWNSQKVPAFLRDSLPLICEGAQPILDCFAAQNQGERGVTIEFKPLP